MRYPGYDTGAQGRKDDWLLGVYGISTCVGYLMSNSVFT